MISSSRDTQSQDFPILANCKLNFFAILPENVEVEVVVPFSMKDLLVLFFDSVSSNRKFKTRNSIDEKIFQVIFGNVEKICEFHQQHFLHELERCEGNPLKVGAAFLEHESKFYLYALYNKNKPKSDSLMSEYGTSFFKVGVYYFLCTDYQIIRIISIVQTNRTKR